MICFSLNVLPLIIVIIFVERIYIEIFYKHIKSLLKARICFNLRNIVEKILVMLVITHFSFADIMLVIVRTFILIF